jgi:hypothetical protein
MTEENNKNKYFSVNCNSPISIECKERDYGFGFLNMFEKQTFVDINDLCELFQYNKFLSQINIVDLIEMSKAIDSYIKESTKN